MSIWSKAAEYGRKFVTGLVLSVPIYITVSDHLFCIARVEGTSMQPTLNPKTQKTSDIVFLDRFHARNYSNIQRGDIIALISPKDPSIRFVKRVIGIEGDYVRTPRYKREHVYVPPGHCWIEGDNSRSSLDSNSFGPVSLGLINGLATHVIWPPKRWKRIELEIPKEREPAVLNRGDLFKNLKCRRVDESTENKDSPEEISVSPTTEAIVEFLTLDDESDLDEDFYIIERCDELGQMPVDDDTPVNDDVR